MSDGSDIFPTAPVWPVHPSVVVEEIIDYEVLSDQIIYQDIALALEHPGLAVEEFMWEEHLRKLNHFYVAGIYR